MSGEPSVTVASVTGRLDAYLERAELEAVWFARPANFAWLTGGDNVVDEAGDLGVAAAGYDGERVTVVTDSIEAPRLRAEELADSVTIRTFPWHETTLPAAVSEVSPRPAAADFGIAGFGTVDAGPLRRPLTDRQCERYRALGEEVAAAVESVARGARATDSEREVAARLRRELSKAGIAGPVVLVGGEKRAQRYRHYTPTAASLGGYALLSVTAERGGLHTSCTRTVAFDPPSWLRERTRKAMRVETTALAATRRVSRESGTAGDVFAAVRRAYDAVGWAGEWREHHQGGATGYAGREWIGTPGDDTPVDHPQGYAWNPTIQGAKSEDTHLVTTDVVELLSGTGEWPTKTVAAVGHDVELPRHGVLERP